MGFITVNNFIFPNQDWIHFSSESRWLGIIWRNMHPGYIYEKDLYFLDYGATWCSWILQLIWNCWCFGVSNFPFSKSNARVLLFEFVNWYGSWSIHFGNWIYIVSWVVRFSCNVCSWINPLSYNRRLTLKITTKYNWDLGMTHWWT